MFRDKDIEKLFRDTLHGFEARPKPEVWDAVSKQLSADAPISPRDTQHLSLSSGMVIKGIIGLMTAGLITAGILFLSKDQAKKTNEPVGGQVTSQNVSLPNTDPLRVTGEDVAEEMPAETPGTPDHASVGSAVEKNAPPDLEQGVQAPVDGSHESEADIRLADTRGNQSKGTERDAIDKAMEPSQAESESEQAIVQSLINERQTKPTAIISATPVRGFAPLDVQFENDGYAVESHWVFEDGSETGGLLCSHTFGSGGAHTVILKAMDAYGSFSYDTIEITVFGDQAPNAEKSSLRKVDLLFTPNGDGNADHLEFAGDNLVALNVVVFDRSGRIVAQSEGPVSFNWDGTMKDGSEAPEGTYFYVIRAKGTDGNIYEQKGYSTILR